MKAAPDGGGIAKSRRTVRGSYGAAERWALLRGKVLSGAVRRDAIERPGSDRWSPGGSWLEGEAGADGTIRTETRAKLGWRVMKVDANQWASICGKNNESHNVYDGHWQLNSMTEAYGTSIMVPKRSSEHRSFIGMPILDPGIVAVSAWDWLIVFLDMSFTAFGVPIFVGFGINTRVFPQIWILDLFLAIVYTVNLFLGFHTGFVAQHNLRRMVVMSGKQVANFYFWHGSFFMDAISAVVYWLAMIGHFASNLEATLLQALSYIMFLRLIRIANVMKILQELTVSASSGAKTGLARLLPSVILYGITISYMLLFIITVGCCLWFYTGTYYMSTDDMSWTLAYWGLPPCSNIILEWIPGTFTVNDPDCWNPDCQCYSDGSCGKIPDCITAPRVQLSDAFMTSFYWSVTTMTTVGYGDISATNMLEQVMAVLIMVTGIGMFAGLIRYLQEIMETDGHAMSSGEFRTKLQGVNRWIRRRKIPKDIQHSIRRFYHDVWMEELDGDEETKIFSEIPHHIRSEVATFMTLPVLEKARIFSGLDEKLRIMVAKKLSPVLIGPGQDICFTGDNADCIWILQEGTMVAMYAEKPAELEEAPAIIAETALIEDICPQFAYRPCGYRSTTNCYMWQLQKRDIFAIMKRHPKAREVIQFGVMDRILEMTSSDENGDTLQASEVDEVRKASKSLHPELMASLAFSEVVKLADMRANLQTGDGVLVDGPIDDDERSEYQSVMATHRSISFARCPSMPKETDAEKIARGLEDVTEMVSGLCKEIANLKKEVESLSAAKSSELPSLMPSFPKFQASKLPTFQAIQSADKPSDA